MQASLSRSRKRKSHQPPNSLRGRDRQHHVEVRHDMNRELNLSFVSGTPPGFPLMLQSQVYTMKVPCALAKYGIFIQPSKLWDPCA
jgi:hypothetical protein